jgi:hypothetical protein
MRHKRVWRKQPKNTTRKHAAWINQPSQFMQICRGKNFGKWNYPWIKSEIRDKLENILRSNFEAFQS